MTLDKHVIDGVPGITSKILPTEDFEAVMKQAGYENSGSAPAKRNRIKVWWSHDTYRRVEAIYSPDKRKVITAYHPE